MSPCSQDALIPLTFQRERRMIQSTGHYKIL